MWLTPCAVCLAWRDVLSAGSKRWLRRCRRTPMWMSSSTSHRSALQPLSARRPSHSHRSRRCVALLASVVVPVSRLPLLTSEVLMCVPAASGRHHCRGYPGARHAPCQQDRAREGRQHHRPRHRRRLSQDHALCSSILPLLWRAPPRVRARARSCRRAWLVRAR